MRQGVLSLLLLACSPWLIARPVMGQLSPAQLEIVIDPVTLDVWLHNQWSEPFAFPGYQFSCEAGCLNPAGHLYIEDQYFSEDESVVSAIQTKLGRRGVLGKGVNDNQNLISELTTGTSPVLQGEDSLYFGKPFAGTPAQVFGLLFNGKISIVFAQEKNGDVMSVEPDIFIPEPSTVVLAGLAAGGLALMVRRRR